MAVRQKHIAVITVWYPTSDSQSGVFVKEQAEALARSGCKISVMHFQYFSLGRWLKRLFSAGGQPVRQRSEWIRSIDFFCMDVIPASFFSSPQRRQKKVIIWWSKFYFRWYCFLNGRPDLIHHHGTLDFSYITHTLNRSFLVPYVITEHSPSISPILPIPKFNYYESDSEIMEFVRNAAERIAVSRNLKGICEKLFDAPFTVIPNMISRAFETAGLPSFPKRALPFQFLNIGHLIPRKRQDILVQAFAMAFSDNENVSLRIVGSGKLKGVLQLAIEASGLQRSVRLLGSLPRKELIEVMDESNVLVVSSDSESFGMVATEAMSRGMPVISTICGGPEELINETNGLLCNRNDIAGMASAMRKMYVHYRRYNEKEIRNNVLKNYSEEVVINRLLDVYQRVINDK